MRKILVPLCVAILVFSGCESKTDTPAKPEKQGAPAAAGQVDIHKKTLESLDKGLAYLFANQKEDGSVVSGEQGAEQAALGATALAVNGAARAPKEIRDKYKDKIAKGCTYILSKKMSDGSFQGPEGLPTYTTAIAVMALYNVDKDKYGDAIKKGQEYLIQAQYYSEVKAEDLNYGGWTYGKGEKGEGKQANLSTTHFALMALNESKLSKDHRVFKDAVVYLQRSQNNTETNDAKGWKIVSDGGFVYGPGMTRASSTQEGLKDEDGNEYYPSYASMTYAGFKSLLYANLPKSDPRVVAALNWIKNNYTLDKNTGMGYRPEEKGKMDQQGLYYFYNAFARAMDAWGEKELEDANGVKHNWARELCEKLMEKQADDGSWVNMQDRWHESLKTIVTGYCIDAICTSLPWLSR